MVVQSNLKILRMTTLSERIREAIETSGVSVARIAEACGISQQAVYDWMKGETRELMGNNLVELAELTGFDPRWIAKGVGARRRQYARNQQQAHVLQIMERMSPYQADMLVKISDSIAEPQPNHPPASDKAA